MVKSNYSVQQERENYLSISLLHQKVNGVAGKQHSAVTAPSKECDELIYASSRWVKTFESYLEKQVGYMTHQYTCHTPRVGTVTVNGIESTIVMELWSDSVLITVRESELIEPMSQLLGAEIVGDNRFIYLSKSQITQLK